MMMMMMINTLLSFTILLWLVINVAQSLPAPESNEDWRNYYKNLKSSKKTTTTTTGLGTSVTSNLTSSEKPIISSTRKTTITPSTYSTTKTKSTLTTTTAPTASSTKLFILSTSKKNSQEDSKEKIIIIKTATNEMSKTNDSNEKPYNLIQLSTVSSLQIKYNDSEPTTTTIATSTIVTDTVIPTVSSSSSSFFPEFFYRFLDQFDRYTLILVSAFFVGLLLIILLIFIAICICKSFSRCKKRRKSPQTVLTNPIYDQKPTVPGSVDHPNTMPIDLAPMSPSDASKSKNTRPVSDDEVDVNIPLIDRTKSSEGDVSPCETKPLLPLDEAKKAPAAAKDDSFTSKSTSSSSSASIDSQILKPNQQIKTSISFVNEDTSGVQRPSSASRFTPSHIYKTQQQLNKELHNSRTSLINNRRSECLDDGNNRPPMGYNKRISMASTTSSSQNLADTKIDFSNVNENLDDYLKQHQPHHARHNSRHNASSSKSSIANSDANLDSVHNSVSNIYINEIKEKRQREQLARAKHKTGGVETASTGSSTGNTSNRRFSLNKLTSGKLNESANVSFDPNGSISRPSVGDTNLRKTYETESVNTLESEKSCY